ncbi:MAG TPA: hypothetical protein PK507_02055 [bacterium]|nr:hypothetical protein [bacterium]
MEEKVIKSFYPYLVDAANKPEPSVTLFKLGNANAAKDYEVFVKVPFMKKDRFDGGEFCLTIHPYFLFEILVSNECYNEFINKENNLIGYTEGPLPEGIHFSNIQYFVSEKLFTLIATNKLLDNRNYYNWLLPNSAWDYDGDYETVIQTYLRLNNSKDIYDIYKINGGYLIYG